MVALRRAARAVQAGDADIVACIAGDTNHVDSFRQMLGNFSQLRARRHLSLRLGRAERDLRLLTAHYMRDYGATREDFGKLCVAQRDNALSFPHALFKKPLTLDEYLTRAADRRPDPPVRLRDALRRRRAFLVMREERAQATRACHMRALLGTIERHNAFPDDPIQMRGGWALDRDELYAQAGVGPEDIDFVQTYDDYPVIDDDAVRGPRLLRQGRRRRTSCARNSFTVDGSFPHNTAAGSCRSARPARPAAFSAWSRRSASSPAQARGARCEDADSAWSAASAWSPTTAACAPARRSLRREHDAHDATPLESAAPKRKNPVLRTRQPTLPPCGAQPRRAGPDGGRRRRPLRAAGLRTTAARCNTRRARPATAACRRGCNGAHSQRRGRTDLADTLLHHSNDLFFRERLPWRLGLVRLDAGPT